jgi:hypothetical protein
VILELGVASLTGWLNNIFRLQIIIFLILKLFCFNLILTVKYRLFSDNCCYKCRRFCCRVPTEPVIVLRWSPSSQKFGRITQKKCWRGRNFCDRLCPSFKAKSPKILILEGLNYLKQWPNFSSNWPKNSAKSCNTGGCCSGG